MRNIDEFSKYFTNEKVEKASKIKNNYFLVSNELDIIKKNIKKEPFSVGLFLGEIKNNKFVPSTNLLDMISKRTNKKVFVNKKTEWLFLCGRDIFGRGISKANIKKGVVLIQNEKDSCDRC